MGNDWAPRALTDDEVERFRVFGFLVLRNWISPDEVATISSDIQVAMEAAYAATPFDGSMRHWLPMMGSACPTLAGFLEDPRFFDTTERLLGAEIVPLVADANRYSGDTPWHCDTHAGRQGARWIMYLQPLDESTGGLRMIPGSHRSPFHEDLNAMRDAGQLGDGRNVPAYTPDVQPGDAIVFNWPTFHASFGGEPDRRMCTVNYFSMAEDPDAIRDQIRKNAGMHQKAWGHRDGFPYHDPEWIANPARSPRRQILIDRMHAHGLFDEAQAGEAEVRAVTT